MRRDNGGNFTMILCFYRSKSRSLQNPKKTGFPGFLFSAARNPGFKILPRIGNTICNHRFWLCCSGKLWHCLFVRNEHCLSSDQASGNDQPAPQHKPDEHGWRHYHQSCQGSLPTLPARPERILHWLSDWRASRHLSSERFGVCVFLFPFLIRYYSSAILSDVLGKISTLFSLWQRWICVERESEARFQRRPLKCFISVVWRKWNIGWSTFFLLANALKQQRANFLDKGPHWLPDGDWSCRHQMNGKVFFHTNSWTDAYSHKNLLIIG